MNTQKRPSASATTTFEKHAQASAERYPMPRVLRGNLNLMLSSEQAVETYWECAAQEDCEGDAVYACGNVMSGNNKLCHRDRSVNMYCAFTCFTGGCSANASVLPLSPGRFCQPCDACFVDSGIPSGGCPAWCADYQVLLLLLLVVVSLLV